MARTPGIFAAAAVSMETIFACATGERRKLIQVWFGRVKSSVYLPEPASRLASSIRLTSRPLPKRAGVVSGVVVPSGMSCPLALRRRSRDDMLTRQRIYRVGSTGITDGLIL